MAAPRPTTNFRLAKEIRVEADPSGAPHITIDDQELPWFTQGIVPSAPTMAGMATLTVTFLADKITLVNQQMPGLSGCADGTSPEDASAVDPGVLMRFRNWLDGGHDEPYEIEQFRSDLCTLLAMLDPAGPPPTRAACPHCPDGHRDPNRRPWSVWVSKTREDGQPPYLVVAPSGSAHVAESDAEWLREVIRNARRANVSGPGEQES